MRRQLYRGGGITGLYSRKKFGLGSDIKERFRKLIPNELADVASTAAPFVAPFYPGTAALMRGIGRFDQRGSISDAFKQGALTYGFGKGARYLGGAEEATGGPSTYSMKGFREGPIGRVWDKMMPERQVKKIPKSGINNTAARSTGIQKIAGIVPDEGPSGWVKNTWKAFQEMSPGMRTAIVGVGSGAITGVAQWFENQYRAQKPGETIEEYLAARKKDVGKLMRTYMDNYYAYDPTYSALDDAGKDAFVARYNKNQGGRVGYAIGSPEKQMEAGAPPIIYEGNMDPRAQNQRTGLPSIPGPIRMAKDGPEFDMRQRGGFQPLGRQEGKDDVPAMLAKNEFVMTADAVRAAGGGSINKGAQRMYDTMKKLERRVS